MVDMMKKRVIFVLLLIFAVFLIGCSSYPGQEAVGLKLKSVGVTTTTLMDNTKLLQRMDANKDGVIDSKDVQAFSKGAKNKNMAFDFNNDKKVNSNDLKILNSNLGKKVNVIKATLPTSTSTLPMRSSIIEPMLVSDVKDLSAFSPYMLTIVPMYRNSLGKFIPFGSYANLRYDNWEVFSAYPRPEADSPLLLYFSNSGSITSQNLMVSLYTNKGVADIYVPELHLSEPHVQDYYFTKEGTTGLFLYVDKKGLTYYARKDHGFGYPDIGHSEALQNEHLAVQSLAGYNLQRGTLNLDQNNEFLSGDWKIKLNNKNNNLEMVVFIGDFPIKTISPIFKSFVYNVDYADKTFWFRLNSFDVANNQVEYTSSFFSSSKCNCPQTQECRKGRCELKLDEKKYGYLYVYEGNNTYNPEWRKNAEEQEKKLSGGIESLTNGKINVKVDIIGEYKTEDLCWNPADASYFEYKIDGQDLNGILPGSSYGTSHNAYYGEVDIKKLDCFYCSMGKGKDRYGNSFTEISLKCDKPSLSIDHAKYLGAVKEKASLKLGFNLKDYDGLFVVYGRFGDVDPNENEKNRIYRCGTMEGTLAGYSMLEFSENNLKFNGILDCKDQNSMVSYNMPGWHIIVHEVLHTFGAVDVYDTGFILGIGTQKEFALELDPKTGQSIMGDSKRVCANPISCTSDELDYLYLDKYNKRLIGIWDD